MEDDSVSAGAVARRLGIAVTTLRTWHQRYGLGPSGHRPGDHRRYDEQDMARLSVMRRLTAEGVPAAEAARVALAVSTAVAGEPVAGDPPGGGPPAGDPPAQAARDGGGNAIAVGRAGAPARGLARAAMRLDASTLRELLERSVGGDGVIATWDELVRPVLAGIGRRHLASSTLIEVEHLVSRCVSEVLGAVPRPPAGTPARVLLACADEEQHSLPLEALAAALAERGVACRQFGARVPAAALCDAVRRTGPTVVMVWSQAAGTADPAQLAMVLDGPVRPPVVAAVGPGWDRLPDGVLSPASLTEAVNLAVAVGTAG